MSSETGVTSSLPPSLSPRRAPKRRRSWGKILVRSLLVLLILLLVAGGGVYFLARHYLGQVNHVDAFAGVTNRPSVVVNVTAQNILLVGSDDRQVLTRQQQAQLHTGFIGGDSTDTMMLIHISPKQKNITVVSIPRDTYALIPAYTDGKGVHHAAKHAKINAAFSLGGPQLMIETVESMTNVHIDHYVQVNLNGFVNIVNAIGGVNVCLTTALHDPVVNHQGSGLDLPAGTSHINGAEALAFVRDRHSYADEDLGRIQAQQRFVSSVARKVTSPSVLLNPLEFNRIVSTATKSITTDMSSAQLLSFVNEMRSFKPSQLQFITVPIANSSGRNAPGIGSVLDWNPVLSAKLFTDLRDDSSLNNTKATALTVRPGSITVSVYNGTSTAGLGTKTANALATDGFAISGPAKNWSTTTVTTTEVEYPASLAAAARTVLAAIPGSTGVQTSGISQIRVITGTTYSAVVKVKVGSSSSSSSGNLATKNAATNICG